MKSSSNNQHRNEKIRKPYPFIIIIFQVSYVLLNMKSTKQVHYPSTTSAPLFQHWRDFGCGFYAWIVRPWRKPRSHSHVLAKRYTSLIHLQSYTMDLLLWQRVWKNTSIVTKQLSRCHSRNEKVIRERKREDAITFQQGNIFQMTKQTIEHFFLSHHHAFCEGVWFLIDKHGW